MSIFAPVTERRGGFTTQSYGSVRVARHTRNYHYIYCQKLYPRLGSLVGCHRWLVQQWHHDREISYLLHIFVRGGGRVQRQPDIFWRSVYFPSRAVQLGPHSIFQERHDFSCNCCVVGLPHKTRLAREPGRDGSKGPGQAFWWVNGLCCCLPMAAGFFLTTRVNACYGD
jgi:hypothetical protein